MLFVAGTRWGRSVIPLRPWEVPYLCVRKRACRSLAHRAGNLRPVLLHARGPDERSRLPAARARTYSGGGTAAVAAAAAVAVAAASSSISSQAHYGRFTPRPCDFWASHQISLSASLARPPCDRQLSWCRHAVVARLICFAPEPRFGRVEGSRSQPLASLFGSANHGHVEKQRLRLPTLPITTRFGPEYCVQFRFCHLACRIRAIFTRRRLCSHSRPLQSKTPPPTLALPPRNLNPISKSRVRSLAAEPTHGVPVAVGSTLAGRSA